MSLIKPLPTLVCCLLPFLGSTAIAQPQQAPQKSQIAKLVELLDKIEKAMKSFIPPEKVEERLKARTSAFRTFKVASDDAGKSGADTGTVGDAPTTKPAEPKSRLLGDGERAKFPKGTVIVVDGRPVLDSEINGLADYFASYEEIPRPDLVRRAAAEFIKVRAVQSAFKDRLPELEKRIKECHGKATADGADFAAVAREHSDCPSKSQGGDLGQFGRSSMVAPFAQRAFTTPVGKVSPVFETFFGYHFLKVTGKQKGKTPAETEARASHVLVMYSADQGELMQAAGRADRGECDIAIVSPEWRNSLPPVYR